MPVFIPDPLDALYTAYTGLPFEDPVEYSTPDQTRVDSKFFLVPIQNEVLNLIDIVSSLPPALTENLITNSGMDLHQRQDPPTATSRSDNTLGPDRFVVLCQNAACQNQRLANGTGSVYFSRLTQNNATQGGVGYLQVLPSDVSVGNAGKTIIATVRVGSDVAAKVRVNIIAWSGAADSLGAARDVVNDWTGAGVFLKTTTAAIIATSETTINAGSWNDIDVQGDVPSNCKNILLFISTDGYDGVSAGGLAQNSVLDVTMVGLYARKHVGTETLIAPVWTPKTAKQDIEECLTYYEKSFALDVNPAQNSGVYDGAATYYVVFAGVAPGGVMVKYNRIKRITPTMTYYNPAAANNKWRNENAAADSGSPVTRSNNQSSLVIENPQVGGDAAVNLMTIHWSAESEIS